MKSEDLKLALRKIIKEEVTKAVQEEVSKAMGKVLVEMVKEIKKPSKSELYESVEEEVEETVKMPILKTNNPKLNAALSQTATNYKPLQQPRTGGSLVELMEGGFEKIGKHEEVAAGTPATKLDFLKQMVNESAAPIVESVLDVPTEALPAPLQNLFQKDFKSILAASKKKSGGYSPMVSMNG